MKSICLQVFFKGICISLTTADRTKVYCEDPTFFCIFFYFSLKFLEEVSLISDIFFQ